MGLFIFSTKKGISKLIFHTILNKLSIINTNKLLNRMATESKLRSLAYTFDDR